MSNFSPDNLRKLILRMAKAGNSVHVACAFSLVEIVSSLFSTVLQDSENRLILSKGHGVMALYAAHYELGTLKDEDLYRYFSDGSALHGLCESHIEPFEVSSGSLGHGLPIAVGMALGFKKAGMPGSIYCVVGDGEMNEGPMWESLLFASHHGLSNLTVIVDANGFQAMGRVQEVLGLEPLTDKFRAFGFESAEVDGHSLSELARELGNSSSLPRAIIARTVKGKGVSFMENNNEWHYRRLTDELYASALGELTS